MWRKIRRILLWVLIALLALFAIMVARNWSIIQRVFLGGVKVYETVPPPLPTAIKRPAILIFSKTNGFRHEEAIPAANALFASMAKTQGWGYFQTENGATFSPAILARFDAVIFNNVSGDVLTPEQRAALKAFVERGGGFVGVHGAGGDMRYAWDWYVSDLIGARFIGHPMNPQFQKATVITENNNHPATTGLPQSYSRIDEWYSFDASPRKAGVTVLATIDETSYSPKGLFGESLAMGKDHPIVWSHCVGAGRVLYSAMGHQAAAYREPGYRAMLGGAVRWALISASRVTAIMAVGLKCWRARLRCPPMSGSRRYRLSRPIMCTRRRRLRRLRRVLMW
jgi:type 1 glutamine amidotransferase